MVWLILVGILSLIVGLLLMLPTDLLHRMGKFLNQDVAHTDRFVNSIRVPTGILYSLVGGWVISVSRNYNVAWYFYTDGIISIFFGLLLIFFPAWMNSLSGFFDQLLFPTDDAIGRARRLIGVLLLIASAYILLNSFRLI